MPSEEYIEKLAKRFAQKDDAFVRLDSMGYIGEQIGFPDSVIREHLNRAADVAVAYSPSQIEALKILDNIYGEASREPRSFLCKFSYGLTRDPMVKICQLAIGRNPKAGDIEDLKRIVRVSLVGAKEGELAHREVPFKPYALPEQSRRR